MKRNRAYKCYFNQWIATLGVFILMMQMGITVGWASPNLARLVEKDSDIPMTKDEISWVASISGLGSFAGAFIASILIAYIGGRKIMISTLMIAGVSWICLIVANSSVWLYAARLLHGMIVSMAYCSFSLFLGEISVPAIRGTLISMASAGGPFGIIIGSVAESYLPMKVSSSIYLLLCFIAIGLFMWIMDSPYHLMKVNNAKKTSKAIKFYNEDCDEEVTFNEIKLFHETTAAQGLKEKLKMFYDPVIRRSVILIIVLFSLPHMGGILNIVEYMETILKDGKSFLIEPKQFVIYANIATVMVPFFTIKLIDILGRKVLLIIACSGTCMALIFLGVHFILLNSNLNPETIQWLPMICILIYLLTHAIGFNTVPSTVLSEIFPDNIKNIAAFLSSLCSSLVAFSCTKAYQPIIDAAGQSYVFFFHAALVFLGIPITLFFLPETKGKSLQEIQNLLSKNKQISKL